MAIYKQFKEVRSAAQSPREDSEMVGEVVGKTLMTAVGMVALAVAIVALVPGSREWATPLTIGCAILGIVVGGMWGMRSVVRKYTRPTATSA